MELLKDVLELSLKIFAVIGAVTGAAMYLLKIYFKKANELEELKVKQQRETVRQMKGDMDSLKTTANSFKDDLGEFRLKLHEHSLKMQSFESTCDRMEKQWTRTAEEMHKRYQALEGAEIIQAGKNTFILKARRQGP